MPAPDSTLQAIQTKVRRLTRSPSTAQLTVLDLDNYINTFVVYDFPEHLRTFNLRIPFTFYTNPYQDEYPTDEASFGDPVVNPTIVSNPMYNFQNKYLTVHPPTYVAGYQTMYTQDREQFFGYYPKLNSIIFTGFSGDGFSNTFSGIINTQQILLPFPPGFQQRIGLLQKQILFDSLDANLNGLALVDVPVINAATGNPTTIGNLYDPASAAYQTALVTPPTVVDPSNTVNYATGVYTASFSSPPGANQPINTQVVIVGLARPQAILFHNNLFTIRPVPEQTYRVNIEVYARPTALLATTQKPELEEYWQYIAYGAAKKIFEDRMDLESVNMIMPEFKKQENLCNRRTIVQLTNERVATIYTERIGPSLGGFGWGNGNNI